MPDGIIKIPTAKSGNDVTCHLMIIVSCHDNEREAYYSLKIIQVRQISVSLPSHMIINPTR